MAGMLYLATQNGLFTVQAEGADWRIVRRSLEGQNITSAAASGKFVLAGTREGIYRSADGGLTWQAAAAINHPHMRWLAFDPANPGRAVAGSEPAAIYLTQDAGLTWKECPEVALLRHQFDWFLPYSPEKGCVRGFTFHGQRAYAAVEVGGVLRSEDGGQSWRLAGGSRGQPELSAPSDAHIQSDVHSIAIHPTSPDLVFAPTGAGFYRSQDGGQTWTSLYICYCRAAWADPADPQHLLLGPADGVSRNGRIEESSDGGRTWNLSSTGLGALPWRSHMVERFIQFENRVLAILSNGEVWCSDLSPGSPLSWTQILPEVKGVTAIAIP